MFRTDFPSSLQALPVAGGGLYYAEAFLPPAEADDCLAALRREVPWKQSEIRLYGRTVREPRLGCWMGDAGAVYRYSGTVFRPEPWIAPVLGVKQAVEAATGQVFNSVVLNLYRDGRDAMGWHSDDEPELGPAPVIASVSLGGVRRFLLRERRAGARSSGIALAHGSLLVMAGDLQQRYRHSVPRTAKPVAARVNLTFRRILG